MPGARGPSSKKASRAWCGVKLKPIAPFETRGCSSNHVFCFFGHRQGAAKNPLRPSPKGIRTLVPAQPICYTDPNVHQSELGERSDAKKLRVQRGFFALR